MQPLFHENGVIKIPIVRKGKQPIYIPADKNIQDYVYHHLRYLNPDERRTPEAVFAHLKSQYDAAAPDLNLMPIDDLDVEQLADYIYEHRPEILEDVDAMPSPQILVRNGGLNSLRVIVALYGGDVYITAVQQRYIQNAVMRSSKQISEALPQNLSEKTVRDLRELISSYVHWQRKSISGSLHPSMSMPENQFRHWAEVGRVYNAGIEKYFRDKLHRELKNDFVRDYT